MKFFVSGTVDRSVAELVDINRNTSIKFYHKLRVKIAQKQTDRSVQFCGEVELDENYFGGVRKGKRGGLVYIQVISNVKTDILMPIIRSKIKPDSVVYTDSYRSYNALDVSEFRHYRINHSESFVENKNYINGIENFWNQSKRHLRKYKGIPKKNFNLFLKGCEWRFNIGYPKMLKEYYN